jgi:adenylosuccinate lyase
MDKLNIQIVNEKRRRRQSVRYGNVLSSTMPFKEACILCEGSNAICGDKYQRNKMENRY